MTVNNNEIPIRAIDLLVEFADDALCWEDPDDRLCRQVERVRAWLDALPDEIRHPELFRDDDSADEQPAA